MKMRTVLGVFAVVSVFLFVPASAQSRNSASNNYLGLGDSLAFGYINQVTFEYRNAQNFVGYPDWTSIALGFSEANAACPGETTGSFLSTQAPDAGCRLYRSLAPLHVSYGSSPTQFAYATNYLQQNGGTVLITLQLGINDVILLEETCNNNPQCIQSGLPQVLQTAGTNIATALAGLRATGYAGAILIANYYSTDYTNLVETQIVAALNQAITAPAPLFGAGVADVFSAFQSAAQQAGGRTCVAGLLNVQIGTGPVSCDIHPSQSGQKLIAQTVVTAYQAASGQRTK